MIIHGGEPPVIETTEPRFGAVIAKLNKITDQVEKDVSSYNQNTRDLVTTFTANLNKFITEVIAPIDAHLNAKGAVHGETSKTVGLDKKDNYRMATLAEQAALLEVEAFVTPQGARNALTANAKPYQLKDYQQNDAFQMASYYVPDEYPVGIPTRVEPTRYFSQSPFLTLVSNGDRLVASPVSPASSYQKQSIFVSAPTATAGGSQFTEVQNLNTRYTGSNWNAIGALTLENKVGLFKPLADKRVYEFKNELKLAGSNANFQLYRGYATAAYKGVAITTSVDGTVLTIAHKAFRADLLNTDPTLVVEAGDAYSATVTTLGKAAYNTPFNGSHKVDLKDFVQLQDGQSLSVGGNGAQGVSTALFWNVQDYELYLMVAVPVTIKSGSINKFFNLVFVESIIPGTLQSGGVATITQLGTLEKDVLTAGLEVQGTAKWLSVSDRRDFNNPTLFPGCILPSGEIVKAAQGKYGLRVKRANTGKAGIAAWATSARPVIDIGTVRTEVYTPARFAPMQMLAERIIPVQHSEESTVYLSYALNRETGKFGWSELTWLATSPLGVTSDTRYSLATPSARKEVDLFDIPRSLTVYAGLDVDGAAFNPLVFSADNNYSTPRSMSYADGKVTLGAKVTLSTGSLFTLRSTASTMRANAMAANPTVKESLRETQIQVYAVTATRALILMSDGLCYAEAAVCDYAIEGDSCVLTFASTGLAPKPVTAAGQTVVGNDRVSSSSDGVRATGSDLLGIQQTVQRWQFAVSKPFGELYGDLSFTVDNFTTNAPVFTPRLVNPARCYAGSYQFDLVDEIHPPVLIPRLGVYQYNPTNDAVSTGLVEVAGSMQLHPYEIGEVGWVFIPAGSKLLIMGRGYILNQEYPIQVNPTGTTYCYLRREGDLLVAIGADAIREPANNEVLFGTAVNGVLRVNNSYLVLDNHLVSSERRGKAIPAFEDDGGTGVNRFFTKRDIIS